MTTTNVEFVRAFIAAMAATDGDHAPIIEAPDGSLAGVQDVRVVEGEVVIRVTAPSITGRRSVY